MPTANIICHNLLNEETVPAEALKVIATGYQLDNIIERDYGNEVICDYLIGGLPSNINDQIYILKLLAAILAIPQERRHLFLSDLLEVFRHVAFIEWQDIADPQCGHGYFRIQTFIVTFNNGAKAKLVFGFDRIARLYSVGQDMCQYSFNFNNEVKIAKSKRANLEGLIHDLQYIILYAE